MLIGGFRLWCLLTMFPLHLQPLTPLEKTGKRKNPSTAAESRQITTVPPTSIPHHIKASRKSTRPTEKHA